VNPRSLIAPTPGVRSPRCGEANSRRAGGSKTPGTWSRDTKPDRKAL